MSENLSEIFTSPTWWITAISSGLLFTVLGNFLTEIIKKKLSKYSASLRSKKSQRIEEQKKLVAELFTNHNRLLFYLAILIVKIIIALSLFGIGLLFSAIAGYFIGTGHAMTALFYFVLAFLPALVFFSLLTDIIVNEVPTLLLLKNRFQMTEETNEKPNKN